MGKKKTIRFWAKHSSSSDKRSEGGEAYCKEQNEKKKRERVRAQRFSQGKRRRRSNGGVDVFSPVVLGQAKQKEWDPKS